MTVCIAAMCDNGGRIVTATDGLVSLGNVTGECVLARTEWKGDWQFMYAGCGANFSLVMEEIENACVQDQDALSRRRIQETVRKAYRTIVSRLSSFEVLSPFDLTMAEFMDSGRKSFGNEGYEELIRAIKVNGTEIIDQMIVTGWGHSPHSAMVYEIGPAGDSLHTGMGFTSIGSGSHVAHTMLVLLGQARHRSLAETIFNVACAKFSSEKSGDLDVGKSTAIYVCQKRKDGENKSGESYGIVIGEDDLALLRSLWEAHLKPRIPDEIRPEIVKIAARMDGDAVSMRDMLGSLQHIPDTLERG